MFKLHLSFFTQMKCYYALVESQNENLLHIISRSNEFLSMLCDSSQLQPRRYNMTSNATSIDKGKMA